MSDSFTLEEERKKEALNTNAPTSSIVGPVVQQIIGNGNPGGQVAAEDTMRKTDQDVFKQLTQSVQATASQIQAAFNAGQSAVSSNPTSGNINTGAAQLGRASSDLLGIKADAEAGAVLKDELAQSKITAASQRRIINAGISPDTGLVNDTISLITGNLASANKTIKDITERNKVGFFDNPVEYLYNNIVAIPMGVHSAARDVGNAKLLQGGLAATTDALKEASVIDTAYFSSKDNERAGLVATASLAAGKAAAMQPLTTALQQSLGALNLKNAEGQLGVAQGNLALARNADARAADMHPLQKEAADLNNRIKKIEIDAAPAAQKQRLLSITNLQNQIDREPDEVKKMKLANEKAALEVQEAQFKVSMQPNQQKLLEKQVEYIDALKAGQIETNKANLAATQQRTELTAKLMQDKQLTLDSVNLYLKAKGYPGDLKSLEGLPKDKAETLAGEAFLFLQSGKLGHTNDPVTTIQTDRKTGLDVGNPENSPPGWQIGRQYANESIAKTEAELNKIAPGMNKPSVEERQFNLRVGTATRMMNDQLTNGWGPNRGVFSTPSLDVLVKDEKMTNNPIIQGLAPLSVDGSGNSVAAPVTGNLLMSTAANMIAKGKLSESDAVKALKAIGDRIPENANVTFGYQANGIPLNQDKFNMIYTQPGKMFGGTTEIVNLKNIADTQLRLRRYVSAIKTSSIELPSFTGPGQDKAPSLSTLETDLRKKARGY